MANLERRDCHLFCIKLAFNLSIFGHCQCCPWCQSIRFCCIWLKVSGYQEIYTSTDFYSWTQTEGKVNSHFCHFCRAPRPIPSCLVPYLSHTCPLSLHFLQQKDRILSYNEIRLGWNSFGWIMLIFAFQTVNKHV